MKITKIEKKKRLYLLEIDKKESLYVTEDTIVKYMLTKEMILDKDQLEDIKSFAQFSHGKNLALYFISFKQRTEKEVKDYLSGLTLKGNNQKGYGVIFVDGYPLSFYKESNNQVKNLYPKGLRR